ncbi:hypothetical protein H0X06_06600 [Candidatus Dependentiae bacterium]|nr:hypothetical protein [Candidatus Dependentiae bacterium]
MVFILPTDVNRPLTFITTELKATLNDNVVEIYIYSSLAVGDFNPTRSDIDLMVAIKNSIEPECFEKLNRCHGRVVKLFAWWNDRIEIAYISLSALKNFKSQLHKIAVISPGEPFTIKNKELLRQV